MGERRSNRGLPSRTDRQIIANEDTMLLLEAVASGRIHRESTRANAPYLLGDGPVGLKGLAREDLIHAPFGGGAAPTLQPRGARLLACWRGELPMPLDD